jgi:ribonucleoside-diphosphate reductase alpha chain
VDSHAPPKAAAPRQVVNRDGSLAPFDRERIEVAVSGALRESRRDRPGLAARVADRVVDDLARGSAARPPTVEQIQDSVERALEALGLADVRARYCAYRRGRAALREAKARLGVDDELKLSLNAVALLRERYLLRDDDGRVAESTAGMMERVARHVAGAEERFAPGSSSRWEGAFADALASLAFLPNSPTLMNAGTEMGLLSGCFVLPVEDSLESIFAALGQMALIHQAGGGTGFSFSRLRRRGDRVRSTHGTASGPVSFIRIFDVATDVVKEGGRRRGANMAVLDVSHPDLEEFIDAKAQPGRLENFNLSVAVGDDFMDAVESGGTHRLLDPRTGEVVASAPAAELFRRIAVAAWEGGDPGILFVDRVNAANPVPQLGAIEATNPCGEVPLLPFESCNLGSINLARMLSGGEPDWERLGSTVRLAVRFLDDVIEVNRYPTPEIERATLRTRKVGVGVMGFAEFLASLGIPYDSEAAVEMADRVGSVLAGEARAASLALARERGPFPAHRGGDGRGGTATLTRNAQLTSIAPTGSISIIAGTTAGIEPLFAVSFERNVLGTRLQETNATFERLARERGFYSEELIAAIARTGGVRGEAGVPEPVRRAFVTAAEVAPRWHLAIQAAFQRHVDAAVSKTVNLPREATVEDVAGIYLDAWRRGAKGVTVYRYGSRPGQVLTFLGEDRGRAGGIRAASDYAGGCAGRACEF